jgi:signal transduction histidine kinase
VRTAQWWRAGRGWAARHVLLVDAALACGAGGSIVWSAAVEAAGRTRPLDWLGVGLAAVAAAGLIPRRRATVLAVAVVYCATLGFFLSGNPFGPIVQLAGLAMYSAGAWLPFRASATTTLAAVAGYLPLEMTYRWAALPVVQTLLVTAGWLVVPWLVGIGVRAYRRERAEVVAADRREHVYQERLRIAKEVHDVVGHSLAVISMQAGVALHVLEKRPEEAVTALRAIRGASTDALGELRATLATFPEPGEPGDPGLDRLPVLVDAVSSAALRAQLVIEGTPRKLPAATDLAAYRIVQEALTNVVRHARARHVTVHIGYHDTVRLTVTDDGIGGDGHPGRGLNGMAERVRAVGGTVHIDSTVDGFEVVAELPWTTT